MIRTGQLRFVYVEDEDGNARRRTVRIGEPENGRVEVISGLGEGDVVIVPTGA